MGHGFGSREEVEDDFIARCMSPGPDDPLHQSHRLGEVEEGQPVLVERVLEPHEFLLECGHFRIGATASRNELRRAHAGRSSCEGCPCHRANQAALGLLLSGSTFISNGRAGPTPRPKASRSRTSDSVCTGAVKSEDTHEPRGSPSGLLKTALSFSLAATEATRTRCCVRHERRQPRIRARPPDACEPQATSSSATQSGRRSWSPQRSHRPPRLSWPTSLSSMEIKMTP